MTSLSPSPYNPEEMMNKASFTVLGQSIPSCTKASCNGMCDSAIDHLFEQSAVLPWEMHLDFQTDMARVMAQSHGLPISEFLEGVRQISLVWYWNRKVLGRNERFNEIAAQIAVMYGRPPEEAGLVATPLDSGSRSEPSTT